MSLESHRDQSSISRHLLEIAEEKRPNFSPAVRNKYGLPQANYGLVGQSSVDPIASAYYYRSVCARLAFPDGRG
jgi:hypothetical protein